MPSEVVERILMEAAISSSLDEPAADIVLPQNLRLVCRQFHQVLHGRVFKRTFKRRLCLIGNATVSGCLLNQSE
jgi:hypothetical protein